MFNKNQLKENLKHPKAQALFRQCTFWVVVLVMLVVGYNASYWYVNSLLVTTKGQERSGATKNSALNKKFNETQKKYTEVEAAKEIWNKVKDSPLDGLKVDKVYAAVEELKKKYYIRKDMQLSIDAPVIAHGVEAIHNLTLKSSNIHMSISAMTDIYAMQFVQDFIKQVPGYFTITGFTLVRGEQNINDEVLKKIINREYPGIVRLDIDLLWRDIYKQKEIDSDTNSAGQ